MDLNRVYDLRNKISVLTLFSDIEVDVDTFVKKMTSQCAKKKQDSSVFGKLPVS